MGCQLPSNNLHLAGSEGYQRFIWLWTLFDDGDTALTAVAITPREQPLSGARWSYH